MQNPEAQQRVAGQLHKACKDVGFFYICNHGETCPRQQYISWATALI